MHTITIAFDLPTSRLSLQLSVVKCTVKSEEHKCTKESCELLDKFKRGHVKLITTESNNNTCQVLRHENDGETYVIIGPVKDDEDQPFSVASKLIIPEISCPVICHGLINAPHPNGKLGDGWRTSIWVSWGVLVPR